MSKANAYVCDYADHLVSELEAVGINAVEDMYDKLLSFPAVFTPVAMSRCDIHFCNDCWAKAVLIPAGVQVTRKQSRLKEREYELKIKELAFGFRSQTVKNHRDKHRGKKEMKKR